MNKSHMAKIVVTNDQGLSSAQKQRLDSLGDVTYYGSLPEDGDEYLQRVAGADVICSGTAGLKDAYDKLRNVYVTVPFVSVAFVDLNVLKKNNVTLSNAPGANKHAVSEWIMSMILTMLRNFPDAMNRTETYRSGGTLPPLRQGLAGSNITILGKGHIGTRVGELAKAFGMNVHYFKRDDDLAESVKDADVVVDTLSSNESTYKLLNTDFFNAMKAGSYLITVSRSEVLDEDALLAALDSGKLVQAASDCGGILVGDTDDPYYQRLLKHPKMIVTPHIAYSTHKSMEVGNDIMIDNVEAWLKGQPINTVTTKG